MSSGRGDRRVYIERQRATGQTSDAMILSSHHFTDALLAAAQTK
jgi:hypothetical protein